MRRVMSPADFGLCPEAPSSVVRVGNKGRRLWFSECELKWTETKRETEGESQLGKFKDQEPQGLGQVRL